MSRPDAARPPSLPSVASSAGREAEDSVGAGAAAAPSTPAETLFEAAWQCELAGRDADATSLYLAASDRATDPRLIVETAFRLAWIALRAGQHAAAEPHLSRALALAQAHALAGPTLSHARYWYAVCVEHAQRLVEAASLYLQVVAEGDPQLWHEAAYRRVACLVQIGDLAGAVDAVDQLLTRELPVSDEARLAALRSLAHDERTRIERALAAA